MRAKCEGHQAFTNIYWRRKRSVYLTKDGTNPCKSGIFGRKLHHA
jgi:hypothetical protein